MGLKNSVACIGIVPNMQPNRGTLPSSYCVSQRLSPHAPACTTTTRLRVLFRPECRVQAGVTIRSRIRSQAGVRHGLVITNANCRTAAARCPCCSCLCKVAIAYNMRGYITVSARPWCKGLRLGLGLEHFLGVRVGLGSVMGLSVKG